jgi:aspartate racemase
MKNIGLLGGMSWESSIEYYRLINELVRDRLGGLHSARSMMLSVNFAEIESLQHQDRWDDAAAVLVAAAQDLERGGADFLVLCTNTMHRLAEAIEAGTSIPFLHIADATAAAIAAAGLKRVGLLGTRFTMEQAFYRGRLVDRHGLDVLVPEAGQRALVHQIIYDELCLGRTEEASRNAYLDVVDDLIAAGAEGIILGCTEIGLLIKSGDRPVPFFDTTRIHAEAAVAWALGEGPAPASGVR